MNWKLVKLADICEIKLGKTPSRSDKSYWDDEKSGSNIWVSIADLTKLNTRFISDSKEYITDKGAALFQPVKAGTLLMSFKLSIGKLAYANCDLYTNEAIVALPIKDKNILDSDFLYYFLQFYDWDKETENDVKLKGKTLNKAKLKEIKLPLPPLATQQKIVAKLDAIFSEIVKASASSEANLKNTEALYKSFLIEFFNGRIVDSKIFSLSDLCLSLHQGLNTAGEKVKFFDSGFPIIQTRNIDNGNIDVTEKLKYLSTEDWMKYKDKFKPEIGDVFFTNIGTIGKTAIVKKTEDYLIHWNIFKIRPNFNLITSEFMKLVLDYLTLSGYFSDRQKGGTVEFVTKKMISDVLIPIPSLTSQIELTNKNDNVFQFCESLKETYFNKLNEFENLKVSTLKQAFNGELVKE